MNGQENDFDALLGEIADILGSSPISDDKLQAICELLRNRVPHYDWVGFYFVDMKNKDELVLGPFSGEPTEHTRIKFGQGICGQAAETEKTFIVQDVSKEKNYLSCSPSVNSEIVVPIFMGGEVIGELDIDSHSLNPFKEEDLEFLEKVCAMLSSHL